MDIIINARTGSIENASVKERIALSLLRFIVTILNPVRLFGMSYAARILRKVLPSKKTIRYVLRHDAVMRADYCDTYWSCLLQKNHTYDAAIVTFLTLFKDTPFAFIDGGANLGYWSILASSTAFGSKKTIAVEAAPDTYANDLEPNCRLNENRFLTLNRGLAPQSNQKMPVYKFKHEKRTLVAHDTEPAVLECETITLDELIQNDSFRGYHNFVVKLSLNGFESLVMNACEKTMQKNTLFIFEDHGSDRKHTATENAIEHLGLRVFWLGDVKPQEISDINELDSIKSWLRVGYSMVATKSPFWISKLEEIMW
jgi:FkbM family methyltransferase